MTWEDLDFWSSDHWKTAQEKLDGLEKSFIPFHPRREDLFAAMDSTPLDEVKVVVFGQDPYPNSNYSTGIAFDIPAGEKKFPPTLVNIFKEYSEDLHLDFPKSGSLNKWTNQGVFLWNVWPLFVPKGTGRWFEWSILTKEIVEKLNEKKVIFVLLGGLARDYLRYINTNDCIVLSYSHPSPLGASKTKSPFLGSRIFSTINDHLCKQGKGSIDWRL